MKLVHYDKARAALEKASQVDDVKSIRDQAEVLRQYARQIKNVEMEAWVAEIKVRAERRAGELLKGSPKAKGGAKPGVGRRGKKNTLPEEKGIVEPSTLAQLGISEKESATWQRLAGVSEADFSGQATRHDSRARELGADVVLQKPVSRETLARVAEALVGTVPRLGSLQPSPKRGWASRGRPRSGPDETVS